jgi:hypothetical protein
VKTLDNLATSSSSLVGAVELEVQQQRDDDNQHTGAQSSVDTGTVAWLVLFSENSRPNDASDATSTDEGSRSESTLPLSTDVVGLPGENSRDIGVAASGGKENAKVADGNGLCEAKASKADDHKAGVCDDEGRANAVLVGVPGEQKCHHRCEDVWRCNQALCITLVEPHAYFKDDREEISDGVGHCRREAEEGCKGPYLEVGFLLGQELGTEADVCCLLREVDNGEVCADGKNASDETPEASLVSIVTMTCSN